jgi:hypothetical protein
MSEGRLVYFLKTSWGSPPREITEEEYLMYKMDPSSFYLIEVKIVDHSFYEGFIKLVRGKAFYDYR